MRVYRPAPIRLDALEAKTTICVSSALGERSVDAGWISGWIRGSVIGLWTMVPLPCSVYLAMEVAAPEKTEDGSRYSIDVKA